jgi:hypothetical protein
MKQRHFITNSERSTAACPQRWLLRYGLGLRSTESAPALFLGTLVHAGIENLSSTNCNRNTPRTWSRFLAFDAIERTASTWRTETEKSRSAYFDARLSVDEEVALSEQVSTSKRILEGYIARWRDDEDWKVVLNEEAFEVRLRKPLTRGRIPASFAGKIDRVVERGGRLWLVETKTSSVSLSEWVERNRRSPQTVSYAIALRERGVEVAGVIFDLVNSKPPKRAEDLEVLKDRSRLAKPSGLPWTTGSEFWRAVSMLGQTLDSVDWYREKHRLLVDRDLSGFWYLRETVLFDDRDLLRSRRELEVSVRKIAGWRSLVDRLRANLDLDGDDELVEVLERTQTDFPREPSLCWQYNRLCSYASLCASHRPEDLARFRRSTSANGHDELTPTESDFSLE